MNTQHLLKSDRILFMGSPDYSVPTLEAVYRTFQGCIQAVITQPDREKGRGKQVQPTAVKTHALEYLLPVYTPVSKTELEALTVSLNPSLIIVIAYGMILPKSITDRFLCLNLHGSLLPAYRGASPVQSALLNGDIETGVTLIRMNERMDEGPILASAAISIGPDDCFGTLFEKLSHLSATLCVQFLQTISPLTPETPQDHLQATYCKKLFSADFELRPHQESPHQMSHKIRAFSPKPGAFIMLDGKRVKILSATLENHHLIPLTVQPEGKKPMPYTDYLRGNPAGLEL